MLPKVDLPILNKILIMKNRLDDIFIYKYPIINLYE